MTDLEINIALAKAMGWKFAKPNGSCPSMRKTITGLFCWDTEKYGWRKFDYRDPVIFVAICKHWELDVNHHYKWVSDRGGIMRDATNRGVEKAAALCAIDVAKRGVK